MTSEVLPAIRQTGRYRGYSGNDPDPVVVWAKLLGVRTSDVITKGFGVGYLRGGPIYPSDLPRSLAFAAAVAAPAALCVQQLSWLLSPERESAAALPALALAAGAVSAPIGIIGGRLSRALERRADDFSLELTGAAEAFVSFERTIALQNVADLAPPWWVRKLLASHPSTAERIGAAVAHRPS